MTLLSKIINKLYQKIQAIEDRKNPYMKIADESGKKNRGDRSSFQSQSQYKSQSSISQSKDSQHSGMGLLLINNL